MKKIFKVLSSILIVALITVVFSSCGTSGVMVPDLSGTDLDSAKTILSTSSLIPVVEEAYDDTVEEGLVISVDSSGMTVPANTRITIYVSKGPSRIDSTDSTIQWYQVGNGKDNWNFASPYIEEGKLIIDCEVTFKSSFSFKEGGFGNASISDTFTKYVPIEVIPSQASVKSGETINITFKIPLSDLDVKKPTSIYTRTSIIYNGNEQDLNVNFSMSW